MPRRVQKTNRTWRKTYLRAYREKANLTLEKAIERFIAFGMDDMSAATLSRIENGKQPYSQPILEIAADAYGTDVASLLMRDPRDPEGIWSIWDKASQGERRAIVDVAKVLKKTAS